MFLGPMMLSNILQSLSGTINSVFLGHMIGVQALAAASAFFPMMLFLISFIMGLGSGASVLVGQAWGAKKPERVQAVAGTTITCSLLAGCTVAILGAIFAPSILRVLATPADILAPATSYARVMLLAMPRLFVFLIIVSMMRGVGDMVTPLKALAVSTAVGLALTPALIRGWLGLPPAGVASAAYAGPRFVPRDAGLARVLTCIGKGTRWRPSAALLRHMKIEPAIFKAVMRIGIPTAVQMVTMSPGRSGAAVARERLRVGRHGVLRHRQPGAGIRAVSGDVDRHRGVDPGRSGDRGRAHGTAGARSPEPAFC